nr:zinc finger, CCHC-type [Tanacetum cinerariifolium]
MTGKKNKEIGSATSLQCPMLNNLNFNIWAIRMQVILEANDLWEVVEPQTTTQIDNKANKTAIAFIFQALPEDQILQVAKHNSARTVWDALKTRHVRENRVQQAKQQTLKAEFEALQMKENELVDSFISKISSITSRATNVGLTFKDSTLNKEIGSATSLQCPMLNNLNFNIWAIRMQVILEANDLWEVVEPQTTTQIDNKANKTAIAFIFQALPEDQILQVAKHNSARTVWDALKTRHVRENRVQQAKQQTLKAEFEALQMKENELVDSFISKISSITSRATNVGLTFKDSTLV